MSRTIAFASSVIIAVLTSACTQAPADPIVAAEPDASDLALELEEGRAFGILSSSVDSGSDAVLVTSGIWLDESPTTFSVDVLGGSAAVVLQDGTLMLNELVVELEGIDHELPGGSRFTDIALVLEHPVALDAVHMGSTASAHTELALRLDWSVSTKTATTPLASQDVESVPIDIHIEYVGDELRLEAEMRDEGGVFELPGLFTIDELDIAVAAAPM